MSNILEISALLKRMSELAQMGGAPNVSISLQRAARLVEQDTDAGSNAILKMYGGMGSLNDVILYKGRTPLVRENNEFDELRTKLFDLTQYLKIK